MITIRKICIVISIFWIFFGIISGCSSKESKITAWDGKPIVQPGIYEIKQLNYHIRVSIDKDEIVNYSVTDGTGQVLIKSTERPSAYQRWAIFWDNNERLWVESSDIGGFLWEKNDKGKYQESPVIDDPAMYKEMPSEVFELLPSVIKNKWNKVRDKR